MSTSPKVIWIEGLILRQSNGMSLPPSAMALWRRHIGAPFRPTPVTMGTETFA
jgi:hypothetical protein